MTISWGMMTAALILSIGLIPGVCAANGDEPHFPDLVFDKDR